MPEGKLPALFFNPHTPVSYSQERTTWDVFSYQDACRVITDQRTFSARAIPPDAPGSHVIFSSLQNSDDPEHAIYRSILAPAFSEAAVRRLESRIQGIVDNLIDAFASRSSIEIINDFAFMVPLQVMCMLLGVSVSDADYFRSELMVQADVPSIAATKKHVPFEEYLRDLLQERSKKPVSQEQDVISLLLAALAEGKLTEKQVYGNVFFLLAASSITTANWIAHSLVFFDQQGMLDVLRQEPELLPHALREVLRLEPSFPAVRRVARQPVEIGGQLIEPGQAVTAWVSAANRDEAFDHPDAFVPSRPASPRHLSFGLGSHYCLGGPLAQLEARIAVGTLLDRFPQLRLDRSKPVLETHDLGNNIQEAHFLLY